MEQRKTPKANRGAKGRGRSRNVGNLHVINTAIPPYPQNVITIPPDYIRTVTMAPKRNIPTPEPLEAKNVAHKSPIATRVFAAQKDATMTYTKKKINAAKNFLQQHNKESPVKKAINSKGNLTDDPLKPNLSSNDPSSNLLNNPLPNPSNNMTSNPPNGSLTSNSSNNSSKPKKFKPVSISHQSHSCLALYEVDMTLKARKLNKARTAVPKEKSVVQEEESGSSWVPVDMKRVNVAKDLSFCDKNKISSKDKNPAPLRNVEENQSRPTFDKNIPKEKKKPIKEIPFSNSKGERTLVHGYSGSSRHFFRHEEEQYYENIYGLSRSSKPRKSRDYEREKRYYKESYPYYFSKKSRRGRKRRKSFHEVSEALEDVSDVPLDEDFEEVETASVEDQNKPAEIPVGFRKYKIRYLASKRIGFFKPKNYNICQDRTIVSCLNMEDESVDVVSEAEYETDHIATEKNSENVNEVELNSGDNKLEITSENAPSDVLETTNEPAKIEHSAQVPKTGDSKTPEKSEPSNSEPNPSENLLILTDLNDSAAMDTNLVDTGVSATAIKEKQEVISSSKFYYTCLPESEFPDFYQGHSLFQKHLDDWESHLIGLEYIVELRDIDKTQANKYYCGLCMEQLTGVNIDGQIVTNHVSRFEHASAYMEVK